MASTPHHDGPRLDAHAVEAAGIQSKMEGRTSSATTFDRVCQDLRQRRHFGIRHGPPLTAGTEPSKTRGSGHRRRPPFAAPLWPRGAIRRAGHRQHLQRQTFPGIPATAHLSGSDRPSAYAVIGVATGQCFLTYLGTASAWRPWCIGELSAGDGDRKQRLKGEQETCCEVLFAYALGQCPPGGLADASVPRRMLVADIALWFRLTAFTVS